MVNIDEIAGRLQKVKWSGNDSFQACCPAHDDRNPSLSVSRAENGKILFFCHAGCSTDSILEALDLTWKDVNPEYRRRETRKVKMMVAEYDYIKPNGDYAYTRRRYEPKNFIIGIKDGDEFKNGLGGKSRKGTFFCPEFEKFQSAIEQERTVYYAEGEKDVLTLWEHGLPAITCGASNDWNPASCQDLIDLFKDANVVILQDDDVAGRKLARAVKDDIENVAHSVQIVVPMPDGKGGDVSDYLAKHTKDELLELIQNYEPPEEEATENLDRFHIFKKDGTVKKIFDDRILEYMKEKYNMFVLQEHLYHYHNGVYVEDSRCTKLKKRIRNIIYPEFRNHQTLEQMAKLIISDDDLKVTMYQNAGGYPIINDYPAHWINFQNGFFDPKEGRMIPHDPKYRAINQIPHTYVPDATMENNEVTYDWLNSLFDDDDNLRSLLQAVGLCMNRDMSQQVFIILKGLAGAGKSTLINLIEKVIGNQNISHISLKEFTERFSTYALLGKLMNSCGDLNVSYLTDVGVLKRLTGEDLIKVERKGVDAEFMKNYATIVFSTNELPEIRGERTNAVYRRAIVLEVNQIPAKKIPNLIEELNVDYFIQLAVASLQEMYVNGRICESDSSKKAKEEWRGNSDSVQAFLQSEKVLLDPSKRYSKPSVYSEYLNYCYAEERIPLTKRKFYTAMKNKGFQMQSSSGNDYIVGITITE